MSAFTQQLSMAPRVLLTLGSVCGTFPSPFKCTVGLSEVFLVSRGGSVMPGISLWDAFAVPHGGPGGFPFSFVAVCLFISSWISLLTVHCLATYYLASMCLCFSGFFFCD